MSSRTQHWQRWDVLDHDHGLVYFTQAWDPIDVEALVKTLKIDGAVESLWQAKTLVSDARVVHAYYGYVDGDIVPVVCSPDGSTEDGENVDEIIAGVFIYLSE